MKRRRIVLAGATASASLVTANYMGTQSLAQAPQQTKRRESTSAGKLAGKVALITGATSGMGRAAAEMFAAEGATVFFCGRREQLGREVEKTIRNAGGEATYFKADVSDPKQVQAFVNAAIAKYGRLDIAYNNAGIGRVPGFGKIADMTIEHWKKMNSVNYDGVFYSMKYELAHMEKQKSGIIINKASTLGLVSLAEIGAYSASKHGVVGLTRSAALDYAQLGIRVNAIAPGPIQTQFLDQFVDPNNQQLYTQVTKSIANKVPLKRWGQPEEVARTALFLASDDSSYFNGHIFVIDGGMGAHEGSAAETSVGVAE